MAWSTAESSAVHESLGRVGRSWGWLLAFGVLSVLAGIAVLTWPGATILVIALVLGVQLLVGGVFWFGSALASEEKGMAVQILLAVLGILAGVVVLRYPVQSAVAFPLVLGLFWTVNGVLETFHAVTRTHVTSRGWAMAAGLLGIVAGVVLLAYPGLGLVTMTYLLGIWLVVYGGITAARAVASRPEPAGSTVPPPTGAAHA